MKFFNTDFFETHVLPNINLTTSQKMVLAKIIAAPEVGHPGKKVPLTNEKLIVAKGVLIKLGLITMDEVSGLYRIMPKAIDIMKEDGLVDETGGLTDIGKDLAAGKHSNPEEIMQKQNQSPMNHGAQPIPSVTGTEQAPRVGESFKPSFKQFLANSN
jgi:hypothetical protein